MPKLSDLYPSKWLTAAEMDENGIIVTIRDISVEKMADGIEKPVLHFDEIDKGLVLNKTNAKAIEKMYGDDTDNWEDERISIYPTYVDFKGEQVEAIRVKPKKPVPAVKVAANGPAKRSKKTATPLTQEDADAASDDDDGPPF